MSKLFPKDSFTIHSDLSAEAIAAQLTHAIAPAPPVRTPWNKPKTPYCGKVTPTGFEAMRVINYRNSFLPQVRGQFEPLSPRGTEVRITLAPHPVVLAFLAVWYFHWYGISLLALFTGGMPGPIALLFLGLPLVIGLAFWVAFWLEADRSRRDFAQLLGGDFQGQTELTGFLRFAQGFAQRCQRYLRKPWVLVGLNISVVGLVLLFSQLLARQQ